MRNELKYALRSLLRSPGFTLVTLFLLTLGLALNTAAFSVISTLVRRPLSFERCDRLALLWQVESRTGAAGPVSMPDYLDWRQTSAFESIGALQPREFQVDLGTGAETLSGARVTPSALEALRWRPALGRTLDGSAREVLISERLWRERLNGAPDIVGHTLTVDGEVVRVAGVLPRISRSYYASYAIWAPADERAADRSMGLYQVVGRLRDGATFAQAGAELRTVAARLAADHPATNAGRTAVVRPMAAAMAHVLPLFFMLLTVTGMILLLLCANTANLQLARAAARQRETALRAALGASRWRILRENSWESVLLAFAAGAMALGLANAARTLAIASVPDVAELRIDGFVFAFTLALALGTGVVSGLVPALASVKADLNETLKGAAGAMGSRLGGRTRSCLVAAELAVALILITGAGVLLKSMLALRTSDPGFRTKNVLTAQISVPARGYADPARKAAFASHLRERAAALPGVESAEVASGLPLFAEPARMRVQVAGREEPAAEIALVYRAAGPGYFRQFGIPLAAGREFSAVDAASGERVAILNEYLAAQLFPNGAAGGRIRIGNGPWLTIVGVSKNVRYFDLMRQAAPEILVPYAQNPPASFVLALATKARPEALAPAMRDEIRNAGRDAAVGRISTVEQTISEAFGSVPLVAGGMGVFACAALLLATVGLYGLVSQLVTQRTREAGIRVALGASPRQVISLFVGHGLRLTFAGAAVGAAGAVALMRLLKGLLFGVSALDGWMFLPVAAILCGIEIAATWGAARRLAHLEPSAALRHE